MERRYQVPTVSAPWRQRGVRQHAPRRLHFPVNPGKCQQQNKRLLKQTGAERLTLKAKSPSSLLRDDDPSASRHTRVPANHMASSEGL